jgi:hypothetical protein
MLIRRFGASPSTLATHALALSGLAVVFPACSSEIIEHRADASATPDPHEHVPNDVPPDARVPDARLPDTRVPDARVPDARASDARVPVQPATCVISNHSTITGVHIEFPSQPCVFTLADAAKGVLFHYDLVVDQDVVGYVSRPTTGTGVIEYPGDSIDGFRVATRIEGGGQRFCLCDQGPPFGFCDLSDGGVGYLYNADGSAACDPITISKGVRHLTWPSYSPGDTAVLVPWHGRNWSGPSDTGERERDPFPPGDYALVVTLAGRLATDAGTTDVGAEARFLVRLVK